MAKTGAIRAGRAFVEIFADNSKLVSGLRAASAKLKAFGASVAAMGRQMLLLGGLVAAPLILAARNFAQTGDAIAKMSKRTGVSVEALSELGYAADLSGASMEEMEKAIRKMQKGIYQAGEGSNTSADALKALGLTVAGLNGLAPEEQFLAIADALNKVEDPSRKAALAMELFGRSGTMLIPMLGDMRALRDEARRLGLTISKEDAAAAEQFSDAMTRLKKAIGIVSFSVGAVLGKALTSIANDMAAAVARIREWVSANQGLIITIAKVAAAFLAAGVALLAFSIIVKVVAAGLAVLTIALKVLGVMLLIVKSPLLLLIAAAAGVAAAILYLTGTLDKALAAFKEFWGGMLAALKAGELEAAFNLVAAGLRLTWTQLTNWLYLQWVDIWTGMKAVAAEVASGMVTIWTRAMQAHAQIVESTANWMAKRWIDLQAAMGNITEEQARFQRRHIDQQSSVQLSEIERRAKAELEAEATRHSATMTNIEREAQAKEQGARTELDAARTAYDLALARAKAAGATTASQAAAASRAGGGAGGGMAGRGVGTFNPAAIRGLLGPQDSILRVNREQLAELKRIAASIIGGSAIIGAARGIGVI